MIFKLDSGKPTLTAMMMQQMLTYGLNLSPTLAHFQNIPKNLRKLARSLLLGIIQNGDSSIPWLSSRTSIFYESNCVPAMHFLSASVALKKKVDSGPSVGHVMQHDLDARACRVTSELSALSLLDFFSVLTIGNTNNTDSSFARNTAVEGRTFGFFYASEKAY
ncbi:hypothetical protein TRV_04334 [Trichophyton verrucosum HKI 0517]|uniref:Uncharacterized protein n=1 Tax=Trichophyton verrucosum (strain HKI 0517) TaxID=663202 RepID=D4DB35_TRIVH|nr:uncharacterized protein TRV_04334 [Trichophyton verrucosum HKI 0517]EFE40869.1 hypothetical protein TRV_04334 [Trichophyton verrucosum HKI 0517]